MAVAPVFVLVFASVFASVFVHVSAHTYWSESIHNSVDADHRSKESPHAEPRGIGRSPLRYDGRCSMLSHLLGGLKVIGLSDSTICECYDTP
jgi:hypothetical protein